MGIAVQPFAVLTGRVKSRFIYDFQLHMLDIVFRLQTGFAARILAIAFPIHRLTVKKGCQLSSHLPLGPLISSSQEKGMGHVPGSKPTLE
ncbi:MAG: hypothetical protein BWY75_00488 [bacterium ADurb.Bin425]|nr:MAG: hypothetical protein BWY75_00488 [bacterium ADurb.Bin425]